MSGIMSLEAPRPSGENGAADWKGKNVQIFSHYGDWKHLALILLLEGALEGKRNSFCSRRSNFRSDNKLCAL
jgi:hypothetical protein